MIKTVIFDLGNVVVPLDFTRCYAALARHCNHSAEAMLKKLMALDLVRRYEAGEVSSDDFVPEVCGALGLNIGYDDFCEVWSSIFLPDTYVPESLLAGLRGRYRLLLLSNTNDLHFRYILKNYPLLGHFDQFVLSYEVGAMKPAPKIYRAALEAAGCRPEECFFTDDVPAYVEGARQAGIDAVRFENLPQLENELRSRSIVWQDQGQV